MAAHQVCDNRCERTCRHDPISGFRSRANDRQGCKNASLTDTRRSTQTESTRAHHRTCILTTTQRVCKPRALFQLCDAPEDSAYRHTSARIPSFDRHSRFNLKQNNQTLRSASHSTSQFSFFFFFCLLHPSPFLSFFSAFFSIQVFDSVEDSFWQVMFIIHRRGTRSPPTAVYILPRLYQFTIKRTSIANRKSTSVVGPDLFIHCFRGDRPNFVKSR